MKLKIIFLFTLTAFLSMGCTTMPMRVLKDWEARRTSQEFQKEKAVFKERLGGKEICWRSGVVIYTWASEIPPKECLYPAGAYMPTSQGPGVYPKLLNVMQTTSKGFLVKHIEQVCEGRICYDRVNPNLVFIHKTDEQGFVDGSYLDEKPDGSLYEYMGPFSYETTFGSKTVHSFKKIPADKVKNALSGLLVYKPTDELFAQIGQWDDLEKSLQNQNK